MAMKEKKRPWGLGGQQRKVDVQPRPAEQSLQSLQRRWHHLACCYTQTAVPPTSDEGLTPVAGIPATSSETHLRQTRTSSAHTSSHDTSL
jgi:hypothetical protein